MTRKLALLCVLVLWAGICAVPATADPGRGATILCYVWANNASPALNVPYTPSSLYSYNAVGRHQANNVRRTAVGTYTVTCQGVGGGALFASTAASSVIADSEGVSTNEVARGGADEAELKASGSWGAGGHVQVTAYGSEDADHCKVQHWTTGGADFSAVVRCYNHAGGLADSRFDLLFVW